MRYLSDIHLEFYKTAEYTVANIERSLPKDQCEVLVLPGDIGQPFKSNYFEFLKAMDEKFDKVFVLPGNHEYYNTRRSLDQVNAHIEDLCVNQLSNTTFLSNKVEFYKGYYFVGATQWGDLSGTDAQKFKINDTAAIKDMTAKLFTELYEKDKQFLEQSLNEIAVKNAKNLETLNARNVIVLTHHLPSYALTTKEFLAPPFPSYSGWFSGNLDPIIRTHQNMLKFWVYGHTHTASAQKLKFNADGKTESSMVSLREEEPDTCLFLCNPLGYPRENEILDYDASVTL